MRGADPEGERRRREAWGVGGKQGQVTYTPRSQPSVAEAMPADFVSTGLLKRGF